MTSDREILLKEIQQLRESRDRWKIVAIAVIFLVFVVLLPSPWPSTNTCVT
jgi:hypothetical protein